MCRRVNFAFYSLLLLAVGTKDVDSWRNYGKILQTDNFEDKLRLVGPRNLLENYERSASLWKENATAVNYTCGQDIAVLQQAIVRREIWALKMLDASSKIPSGILEGNIIDLGMYDECIAVRGESLSVKFRGQHCMYSIKSTNDNANLPLYPTLSICVPATCSANDITDLFNKTINAIDKLKNLGIVIASVSCTPLDPKVWDTEFIVCFSILVIFLGFLIISSICDAVNCQMYAGQLRHPALCTLSQFSLQRSTLAILSTSTKDGNLPVIHGIRFLSITWIVLGHEYVTQIFGLNVNNIDIMVWIQSWQSLYIFIAQFAVDTFFAISGFLMTYLFLNQMRKQKKFNVPMYYLHRYIRLTFPVIGLILFTLVFVPKIGSGARWNSTTSLFLGSCRQNWWINLLYVQNFVDRDNMCLAHLWYLAVDMQLFWISPIILYPLYKKPKIGLAILASLFLVSLTVPATIIGVNQYREASFVHIQNITMAMDIFENVYEVSYNRAAAWLVGILFGFKVVNKSRRLRKMEIYLGWALTAASLVFCTLGTRSFMKPSYVYDPIWETFFTTVSRPIWAFGVCWIIYASINNCAGPVGHILSWKFFQPLSRLSYCLYLVHLVLQVMQVSALRTPSYFSEYYVWRSFMSDFGISLIIAFFFSLLFESPILVLERVIFKRESHHQSQESLIRENHEEDVENEIKD